MNHIYRIVWNEALGSFVAVAEHETARGKSRPGQAARRRVRTTVRECFVAALSSLGGAVAVVLLLTTGQAWAEPSGGQVTAGAAGIQQTGSTTVITQTTPKVAIQWQRFDIERGETVRFDQPSASAIALNRVIGTDGSRILGQLQANGQVFLINPNGILFGRGAQVDVGGLVASTLNLTDDDFLAGRFSFSGAGGSVRNEGRLTALGGGSIALLGGQVSNTGEITADRGSAALAAGKRVTLDFGGDGLLKLSVDEGTLNALVDNGGLVRADGGSVLLTARAADALRATVVNHTGLVQARTLENKAGVIKLLGGLDEATGGTVVVNGKLDASAPNGGNGGFIEASAHTVRVLDGTQATTLAPAGKTGEFLIDPSDFTITDGADPSTGSGIGNLTLQGLLAGGNFTAATTNTGTDAGNLMVDGAVTWTSTNTLKLQSRFGAGGIQINQPLSFANGTLQLDATGNITAGAAVSGKVFELQSGNWQQIGASLPSFSAGDFRLTGGSFVRALGGDGSSGSPYLLTDVYGLQGMGSSGMLGNSYQIANNIDASGTVNWYAGLGWKPVGDATNSFTGSLNGAGFTVSSLTIARPSLANVGLIGRMLSTGSLQNLTLENVSIDGGDQVGAGVGYGVGSATAIDRLAVTGSVSGAQFVGGLVGRTEGSVSLGVNAATVTSRSFSAGGIVGLLAGSAQLSTSYNTGTVTADTAVGGLAGSVFGLLQTSFNTGQVHGSEGAFKRNIGGVAGEVRLAARVRDAYSTGAVVGGTSGSLGGALGAVEATAAVDRIYSTGAVSSTGVGVGGLVGTVLGGALTSTNSFWDTTTSGQATSALGVGKTTAELKTLATFTGAGWTTIDDAGSTGNTWRIYGGNTTPLLRSFMTPLTATPDFDGSGTALTNIASIGAPFGTDFSRFLGGPASTTLTLRGAAAGSYTAEVDTTGLYSNQLGYDLARTAIRTIATPGSAAGDIVLPGVGVVWDQGTLAIDTTGTITAAGRILGTPGTVLDLKAGTWRQVNASLPTFSVGDFRISGGTFIRALGGDGSSGSPYQIADVYGLQGLGSSGMLASSFQIANDINASGTANWSGGLGWKPVGEVATNFTGRLDGAGHTVSGLTMARFSSGVGLIGQMGGSARLSSLTLSGVSVSGFGEVGAAVGRLNASTATIDGVKVTGSVTGTDVTGGLVGRLVGTVTGGVNEATVTGTGNFIGGVAGLMQNTGRVATSYNTGVVTGGGAVGGVVGWVQGVLETSFNTGQVRGNATGSNQSIGGLVGQATGTVRDAYSTGAVVGGTANQLGGAIGVAVSTTVVDRIYSTGAIGGSGFGYGGLVGIVSGGAPVVTNSFWDTSTSGRATSALGVGKTTAELKTLATFTGAGWDIDDAGGTGKVWRIYGGNTMPLLRSFMTPLTLLPDYDGGGTVLLNLASVTAPIGTDFSLFFGGPTSTTLTLRGAAAGSYTAEVDATGLYSKQLGYDFGRTAIRTIATPGSAAGDIVLPSVGVGWGDPSTLAIDTTGTITAAGRIFGNAGGVFDLKSGTWRQVSASLPDFAVRDFRLSGGTFIRALGGDGTGGTPGNPYQLTDVYGLQGMGSSGMLGLAYRLANDIDASGTVNWNAGAGWRPVGVSVAAPFTGSLDGNGRSVSSLTINRPSSTFVGLFGGMGASSSLSNIRLEAVLVRGSAQVGAAAGSAAGTLNGVRVEGSVRGSAFVGGLTGMLRGSVTRSVNEAAVAGADNVGGVAGSIEGGRVSASYNTGAVSGGAAVGGVAGRVIGTVENTFNTGTVTGDGGGSDSFIGGISGNVLGTIRDSYSIGTVNGGTASFVGGAVGALTTGFQVTRIYSSGAVSSSGSDVGGLVGIVFSVGGTGGITNSFWDPVASGQLNSAGGTPKTAAELKTLSTFTSAGWDIDDAGGTGKVWRIYGGNTMPLLRGFMTGLTPTPDYDGSGTLLANIASFSLPGGTDASRIFGSTSPTTLTLRGGAAGGYTAEVATAGLYSNQLGYDIGNATRTIATPGSAAGDITLPNGVAWTNGTLAIDTTGSITAAGAIAGGAGSIFDLQAGTWRQVNTTLPGFAVRDFRLSGGSFVRAKAGDGSSGTPYEIADVHGLQGMGSSGMLGLAYRLANDIDASGTATWNAAAGWKPVGDSVAQFSGSLDGDGRSISGLTIDRPASTDAGLFGEMGASSSLSNVRLADVSVRGRDSVGAAAGLAAGSLDGVRVSGTVTGISGSVGGLTGRLSGSVTRGINEAAVAGAGRVGGIAGATSGADISLSYNTGTVTAGFQYAGGLVGEQSGGVLRTSFNTGEVIGGESVGHGGLVGSLTSNGTLQDAYNTGAVSAGSLASRVGGAVGNADAASTVQRVYSTGAVSSAGSRIGGLIGFSAGTVTGSFWDPTTSGQSNSSGGTEKTAAELKTLATFTGAGWDIDDAGGTGKVWRIYGGNTLPLLRGFMTGLDLSAASTSRTYDATTATLDATLPSGVLGSGASGKNAGSYRSGYYSSQLGYDITQAVLTIDPAVISLSGQRVYDADTAVAAGVLTTSATVGSETLTLSGSGSMATKDVGTAKPVSLGTLALGDGTGGSAGLASNYTLVGGTHTVDITAKSVTVSGLTADNKVYDATRTATLNTSAAQASGLIDLDDVSFSATGATGSFADKNVGTGKAVTVTGTALSGAAAGNYTLSQPTGLTADVTAKSVTVSGITAANKVYDATRTATLNTTAAQAGGLIDGDDVSFSAAGAAGSFADKNVGTGKAVTVTGTALSGAAAGNYTLSQPTGLTADITAKSVTVSGITADNKVYDATRTATLNTTAAQAGGLIDGDDVSFSAAGAAGSFADKNVGTGKVVTVTGTALSGASAGNYALSQPTGLTADITAKSVTVSGITADNKVYDATRTATLNTTSAQAGGLIDGDDVSFSAAGASGSFADKNVGTGKAVTVTGTALSGAAAGNYALSQPTGLTADITAKSVTVSGITADNKVYDATRTATLNTTSAQAGGLIDGDDVSFSAAGAAASFADKNVGTGKAVTVTGTALSGASAGNYALSQPTGLTADITAKSVTVSGITADNKVYDATRTATLNTTSAQAGGLIDGDEVSFSAAGASGSFADKNVGTGKAVTVTGTALSGAAAGNYALSQPTGLTADITAKSVTVSGISADNKVYDATRTATLNTTAAQAGGLIDGDEVSFSAAGASGSFADKNVGTSKAVTVTGTALSGTAAGNYALSQPTGLTADITAKSVTVSGISADNKVYDATRTATLNTTAAQAGGLIDGDEVSFSAAGASGSFADKNVGAAKAVTVTGTALSGASAGNYSLSQPTGLTADITAKSVTVSGITADNKVYDATRTATLNTSAAQASGLIDLDDVSFSATGATGSFADKNVGTGKAVTVTGTALSGAAAGNYTLSQPTGLTADVTAKSVTVSGITAANKVYDATRTATMNTTAAQAGGLIDGDDVSFSAAGAAGSFADKNVGTGKAVTVTGTALSGAAAGNYTLSQPTGLTADITAKSVTVSGITADNKVYDATRTATLNTTAAQAGGLIDGDDVSFSAAGAAGSFADKNVGTGKVVTVTGTALSGASAGNYALSQPTGLTADITAKSVTVSGITADNKVYDATRTATLNTTSAQAGGLIDGDDVSFSAAGASGSFADKNVGTGKAVTVTGTALSGAAAGNYALSQPTGLTADITAKSVTVSGITADNKVYDATRTATLNTTSAQAGGLIDGDDVSFSAAGAAASFADKNVGTGKAVTVTGTALSGASAGNYALSQPTGLTADITAKSVTVSGITADNKVYDATRTATLNTTSAQAGGLIDGDDVSFSAAGASGSFADKNVGTSKAVTVTGTALSGTAAGNYALSQPTGLTADITAKSVTVSGITADNKVYDATRTATLNTTSAQASGLIDLDDVSFSATGATGSFADKNVGTGKAVTVSGTALSGLSAGNYSLSQPTGVTADITAKSVTVSGITAANKVYDNNRTATLDTTVAQGEGLIPGDGVTLEVGKASGLFADKNVGTGKAVTVSGTALSGLAAGNYSLSQPTGVTADITAKSVTVSGITADNKVYDATRTATLNTTAAQAGGLIDGDDVSFSAAGAAGSFADKNVGAAKAVTVTGTALSGASAGNYALSQPTGLTADITAKAVTVTGITADNKVYDATRTATLNTTAAQAGGLIDGDDVSFSAAGAAGSFADKNVGAAKAVTVTGTALSGASAGNYALSQPTGLTADISAKSVTVSGITTDNKVYDATRTATLNTTAAQAGGLIDGDDVSFSASAATGSFADKNVGTAKAVSVTGTALSGASAGNYALSQPTGLTADITAKSVTVSGITADNKVYDATRTATLNTTAAQAGGLIDGDEVSFSAAGASGSFADKNVGTGKAVTVTGTALSGAAAGNYALSQPTGLTADITAKSVTVSGISADNKVYDATRTATLNTTAAQAGGLIDGDEVSFSAAGASGSFADKNVGTSKAVTVTGTALSGTAAGNYALSQPTGLTADITAKSVTVSGISADNKVYDATRTATLNTTAAQAGGLIDGDEVSFSAAGASGSFADKNVGAAKAVTVTGTALSGASAGNYSLSQPTGLTADITAKSVTVSGITADNKVYDATRTATLNTTAAQAGGLIDGDEVSFSAAGASGSFADKNVGTGKAVTVTGTALSGAAAGNYALSQPTGLTADITAKSVSVSGISADNKVYDATRTATLNTTAAQAGGLIDGDDVSFSAAGAAGSFADKNVGTGKAVTVTGTALSGTAAGNYALSQPTGLTADITAKSVTVSGITADNKVYDATRTATLNTTAAQAGGLIDGDEVSFSASAATGSFADKNVGTAKAVTVTGTALSGASAGNYALSQPTGLTADITAKSVSVSGISADNKVYDATRTATLNTTAAQAGGLIDGDDVSFSAAGAAGSFADKNVGTGKAVTVTGTALSGTAAGNYALTQPTGLTADITAKSVSVSGITANNKVYDATRTATLNTTAAQAGGLIDGDDVSFSASAATGSFADKNVGTAKAVTVTGTSLSGASASNYALSQPTGLTADITAKSVSVSGITAESKVYDATRTATLNTTAAQAGGLIDGDEVSFSAAGAAGSFADKNVGTGKAVTVTGTALSGASAGNYALSQPTGLTADITAKSVSVSGITAESKVYDATRTATLNTTAAQAGGLIDGDEVSFSAAGASGSFADKNVGTSKAVTVTGTALSGAAAGNYALSQPTGLTADITTKSVTVTGITANNKVYDATRTATLNTTGAVGDGLITGDDVTLEVGKASGEFADKNVGTGKAVAVSGTALSGGAAGNYALSQPTGVTADITAKSVTVTGITANDKVYDATRTATLNTAGAQADGLVAGDDVSFSAASANGSFADKNVGTGKSVTVSGAALSGAAAGNYALSQPTGVTADITAKAVTVTGVTANDKVYDATRTATLNTGAAQADGLIAGDDVNFSVAGANGSFADKNVGTGKAVTVSGAALSGAAAGNYTLSQPTGLTADITAKAVSVTGITATHKVYDATRTATLDTAGAQADGLITGDEVSFSAGGASGSFADKNVGTGKAVTVSGNTLSGASAGNYTLTQPTGLTADITARSVTVTGITASNKVYDATRTATLNTAGAAGDGLITGDEVALDLAKASGEFADKNVGTGKAVTVSGTALSGAAAGNYTLSQPTGVTADITAKAVTVTGLTANSKVYDATVAATLNTAGATADGLIAGDEVSFNPAAATGSFADKNVGTGKAVSVNGTALSGAAAGNYTLSQPTGLTADITAKAVTVTGITANDKVYDATRTATLNTAAAQADGLIAGDEVSFSAAGATGAFADKNVGAGKAVAVGGNALSGAAAGNYMLSQPTGLTADITAKAVSVTGITANDKVYDATRTATLNTAAAQADGLIGGDEVSFSAAGASGSFADKNVGTGKAVTVSGTALSGAAAGNYTLSQPTGVTADITAKAVTVTGLTANSKVYDATVAATLNTAGATADGLIAGDEVSFNPAAATGSFADKNVGTGKAVTVNGTALSGSAAGNYTLSQPTGLTADITAKAVTVTGITANDKVYDATRTATLNTAAAQADGLIAGDEVSFSAAGASGSFADKHVGTGKAVTVSGTLLSGAAAGNYSLDQPTGVSADITAKAVTVSGITAESKVYDATRTASLNTAAAQADGLIPGDEVSFSAAGATGSFADKNVGTGKAVTIGGNALSGASAGNYTLTQPTGIAADITPKDVTVTGLTASGKRYDATTTARLNLATARVDGAITGDDLRLDGRAASGRYDDPNVGYAKPITVSGLRLDGTDAGNYRLQQPGLTSEIIPALLTAVVADVVKIFGSADPLFTYGLTGAFGNDVAADFVSGRLVRDAGEAAGSYAIRPGSLGSGNPNYTLVVTPASLRILPILLVGGGSPATPPAEAASPVTGEDRTATLPVPLRDLAPTQERRRPAPPPESVAPLLRIRDGGVNMPLALLDR